jgi:hypothetical protein
MEVLSRPSPSAGIAGMYIHQPEHFADRPFLIRENRFDQQFANKRIERGAVPLCVLATGIKSFLIKG